MLENLHARFGGGRMEKVSLLVSRKGLRTPEQAENLASRLPYCDHLRDSGGSIRTYPE